ncbi:MAG: class I SAM-dependent methyltransferase [Deltaproteobacteria bacterium]|nr:class I SAM-dependent methyltransferase [Deltaproteobacteria bacterium]
MNNYEFCAQWAIENGAAGKKVLDYGCGAGEIVVLLRERGIEAYGCDVFYEGGDYSAQVPNGLGGSVIRRIEKSHILFDSGYFDFVINNQVMEHVEDLDSCLSEIKRVLKPGGKVLSLFPDKGVWREGHCGIPFLHWFPKRNSISIYYAAALRAIGMGYHKKNKGNLEWSRDFCLWLDRWTYYRSLASIHKSYEKYFSSITHIELYWLYQRFGGYKVLFAWLPKRLKSLLVRKLGGLVFECSKEATS